MVRALLLTAPILIAAGPSPGTVRDKASCQRIEEGVQTTGTASGPPAFRRLDQLPPASEYITVLHIEGGCVKPQIVGYKTGPAERR